ncbi:hypothetical protein [Actinomyces bowdenii]|uniref:hypothetical protein n=1 Tax=Actinomyces bowdenii TaxID=131109 RepID=UPI001FD45558|nr:hypothetical protein [Actinomyces bowdenii]
MAVKQGGVEGSEESCIEVGGRGISRPFHVLVDESEVGGYSMTAVAVRAADVADARAKLKQQMRKGQRSIHFTNERPEARKALIEMMTCRRLVLDRSDSVVKADRQVLQQVLGHGWEGTYDHLRDHEEPLLWLADGISWCWNRGGDWRERLSGIEVEVVELSA